MLHRCGIDTIVFSGSNRSFNPIVHFYGDSFDECLVETEKNPIIKLGLKMIGPKSFTNHPDQELYFPVALKVYQHFTAVPTPPVSKNKPYLPIHFQ